MMENSIAIATVPADNAIADEVVPGTIHLVDLEGTMNVKHDGHYTDIVLYPTPSSDPKDPLNWSYRRKITHSLCLQLYTFFVGVGTATCYSVYPNIIENTGIPLATLNQAVSVLFLMFGWGTLFWNSIALQYGRRGVYIVSCIGCMCMTIWAPYTTSSGTWYAHRFFYGLFGAPIEALVEQSIPDVFFTHERGTHIGLFLLWLGGSSFLAPIASGYVVESMNWKWCFHFPAIFLAMTAIILFFFLEESMYDRELMAQAAMARGATAMPNPTTQDASGTNASGVDEKHPASSRSITDSSSQTSVLIYEEETYWQRMRLFRIIPGKKNQFLSMIIRPLTHIWNFPIMTMCGVQYGTYLMFFMVLNGTWTTIFQGHAYNFSSGITGVLYICPFIGGALASVYAGSFSDWFHTRAARRNGGIREPEQRLWLYLASTILMPGGLILYGVGGARGLHWMAPAFGSGLVAFTGVTSGATPIAYISDSYKDLTGEGMVTMTIIRNTMGFAMGYAVTPWIEHSGLENTFITIAMIAFVLTLFMYPLIWFGKAERRRTAQKYYYYARTALAGNH